MRWKATASAVVITLIGCSTTTQPIKDGSPIWPPIGAQAPAEVVWRGEVRSLRYGGISRIVDAVAGADETAETRVLLSPIAVSVYRERLFVLDVGRATVSVSNLVGRGARRFQLPKGFLPSAMAVASDGRRVLLCDGSTGRISAFSTKGAYLEELVPAGVVGRCGGIAACRNGAFVVTDVVNGAVLRFDAAGNLEARVGRPGTGLGEFNRPGAIQEAPGGDLWVVDTFNFRLQRLKPDLAPVSWFGSLGDGSGHFALPKGLAIDSDGHLYVADGRFDVIQLFDSDGRLLMAVGRPGRGPGEFWNLAGLASDSYGNIVVADAGNRRVQLLRYQERKIVE
jgi:DNA-binding beta-propeller fold protein YncE